MQYAYHQKIEDAFIFLIRFRLLHELPKFMQYAYHQKIEDAFIFLDALHN
jgi:hypothetical protein